MSTKRCFPSLRILFLHNFHHPRGSSHNSKLIRGSIQKRFGPRPSWCVEFDDAVACKRNFSTSASFATTCASPNAPTLQNDETAKPPVVDSSIDPPPAERIRWRFREQGPIGNNEEVRVLLAGPHFHAARPWLQAELDRRRESDASNTGENRNILLVHAPTTDELKNEARTAHVAIPFMEAFRKDFFHPSTTPDLRLVAQFGVGLEGVDMDEASAQGIAVTNVPAEGTGNAQATAEHAVFLGISLLRGIPTQNFTSRFPSRSLGGLPIPRTLYRKRVTVVGYGAVGSCLARYLSVLGAEVTVVRRMPWDNTADEGFGDGIPPIHKADDLQEALASADILFLACTLTPETKSLVNATTIEWLPKGALVVNIARGGLVDHGAMLDALRSGAVGGFASDVGIGHPQKVAEPWDPDDEICHLGPNANVLFTPHIGGYCDASYDVMAQKIADAIEHVIRGEAPPVWVNEPKR